MLRFFLGFFTQPRRAAERFPLSDVNVKKKEGIFMHSEPQKEIPTTPDPREKDPTKSG